MAASKRMSSSAEMSLVATTHRPLPDFHTILTTLRQLKGYYSNIGQLGTDPTERLFVCVAKSTGIFNNFLRSFRLKYIYE